MTSFGSTSNMLWIRVRVRVWFEVGLKARKDVQRRVASVQSSGVGYERQRESN